MISKFSHSPLTTPCLPIHETPPSAAFDLTGGTHAAHSRRGSWARCRHCRRRARRGLMSRDGRSVRMHGLYRTGLA